MENSTVIILASSRPSGNTRKVIDAFMLLKKDVDVISLSDYKIGYYDYAFKNKDDDFMEVIKKVINYKTIIFATPIYWYTMSAQLKTFFDRISDLLHAENKPTGRQLRGKQMAVISCGSDSEIFDGFEMPFRESANYLGMHYIKHIHTWVENGKFISDEVKMNLKKLASQIE